MATSDPGGAGQQLTEERFELLHRLENLLETPLIVLGFVWLALLVMELVYGASALFETLGMLIWIVFLLDFAVKFFTLHKSSPFLNPTG